MSRGRTRRRAHGPDWGRTIAGGLFLGLAAFVLSLVLAAFGFFTYAKSYIQGARFHRMVEGKLSEVLKAELELAEVRWEGSSAFAARANAQGYEDAGFARFGLAGLRADLDLSTEHFKRGVWKVPEISISQLDVLFSETDRLPGPYRKARKNGEDGVSFPGADSSSKPNLISQLIPREIEMDELRFTNLNLFWESPGSKTSATGMLTVARPTTVENGYQVQVRGGMIQGTETPKLDIDRIDLRWRGRDIFVSEALLRGKGDAKVELRGDLSLGGEDPGEMLMDAEVSHLPLAQLSDGGGQSRVSGDLAITARVEGDPGDLKECRQEGTITITNGVVQTLPILEMLATFTDNKRFERIALRDGGGAEFVRQGGRTEFSEIDFQSDGLGRLTGDLVVEDGNLAGLLQLGVIPGTLKWIPTAEQKIFTDARGGHLWTDVRVSGTVDHPKHDLTPRLASAGVEAAIDMLGSLLNGEKPAAGKEGEGEEEADGGILGKSREQLDGAMDLGRELLRGFLR